MSTTEIAVVTGSTNNIGKGIARGLSEEGYHVVVTSRHQADTEEVATSLPNEASGFEVDFAEPEEIDALFSFVDDLDGRLAVLVNNVAYSANETIFECDLETWNYTLNTNLRSYYYCTKLAAERMRETGGGNVVNISTSRTMGKTNKFTYSVTKGGINWLTRCAARELAPHDIRVNAVGAGQIGTPLGQREQTRNYELERAPIGHIGEPADIAGAVRYLVSEDAKYVVGGLIPVDGGKEA